MARVINKNTLQIIDSANTPEYLDGNWIINPDLTNVNDVPVQYWKVSNDVVVEMDQSEKDVVDSLYLQEAIKSRINEVDIKSIQIIERGFSFDGSVFSLSQNAQLNWNSLKTLITSGDIGPDENIEISTKNSHNDAYILTPDKRTNFFGLAFITVKQVLNTGRSIRQQMKQATSIEELNNIIDDRI